MSMYTNLQADYFREGEEDDYDNQDESNFEKNKHKRRSKNDNIGRDFACGCGKKYLSYPALYTHIKTKHGGEQPTGTKTS
jgi:hypothetical protein